MEPAEIVEEFVRRSGEEIRETARAAYANYRARSKDETIPDYEKARNWTRDSELSRIETLRPWIETLLSSRIEYAGPRVLRTSSYSRKLQVRHGGLIVVPDIHLVTQKGKYSTKKRVTELNHVTYKAYQKDHSFPTLYVGGRLTRREVDALGDLWGLHILSLINSLASSIEAAVEDCRRKADDVVSAKRAERADEDGDKLREKLAETLSGTALAQLSAESLHLLLQAPPLELQNLLDLSKQHRALVTGSTPEVCASALRLALAHEVMET